MPGTGPSVFHHFPFKRGHGLQEPISVFIQIPEQAGPCGSSMSSKEEGKQKRGTLSGKKTPYFLGLTGAPGKVLNLSLGVLRTWNGEGGIVRADVGGGGGSCLLCWIKNLGDYCGVSVVILSPDLDSDTGDKYEEP